MSSENVHNYYKIIQELRQLKRMDSPAPTPAFLSGVRCAFKHCCMHDCLINYIAAYAAPLSDRVAFERTSFRYSQLLNLIDY